MRDADKIKEQPQSELPKLRQRNIGSTRPKTSGKQKENAVQEIKEQYEALFNRTLFCVYVHDFQGRFLDANAAALKLLGYRKSEIRNLNFSSLLDGDQLDKAFKSIEEIKQTGSQRKPIIYKLRNKGGGYVWVETEASIIYKEGKPFAVQGIARDITDHLLIEESLRESEEMFREMSASAQDAIIVIDNEGNISYWNDAAERIFGYTKKEAVGQSMNIIIPEEYYDAFKKGFARFKRTGNGPQVEKTLELTARRKDGTKFPVELSLGGVKIKERWNAIGLVRDITERKMAAEALRKSEAELRALIAAMTDIIIVLDVHGRYLKIPATNPKLLYKPAPELIGKTLHEIFPKDQADFFLGRIRRALDTRQPVNIEYRLTIGAKEVWFSGTVSPMTEDTVIWVARDITNRKIAEKQLRASETKYRGLLKNLFDGVYQSSPEGRFLMANPAIVHMLGYESEEELLRINVRDLYLNPEDRDSFAKKIGEKGEVRNLELALKRKDGQTVIALENARMMHSERGELYYEGTLTDISDLKRAEERIRASLAEKEILLKEIHHRVKNNMQIISSLLNLQANQTKDDHIVKLIKVSQSRIRSMALVHEKLYRSRDLAKIDFSDYVESLIAHLFQSNQVNSNSVHLQMKLEEAFLDIQTAIPCGLILNELVTNSVKHAFPGGRVGEITVEMHPLEEHTFQIIVKDNGVGIPKDLDIKHPPGMGLQIVTMLVNQLEGSIEVQRDGGTTVTIVIKESIYESRI